MGRPQSVRRPLLPDLARILLIELVFGALFVLLFGALFGWWFVAADWFAWPIALVLVAPVELWWGFPTHTARSVTASEDGFQITRRNRAEPFLWSALNLAAGSKWHPLYGTEFLESVVRPDAGVHIGISLTSAQHALFLRWARAAPESRPTG